jgi:hypothetical protein
MKKIFAVLLALVTAMALVIVACGDDDDNDDTGDEDTPDDDDTGDDDVIGLDQYCPGYLDDLEIRSHDNCCKIDKPCGPGVTCRCAGHCSWDLPGCVSCVEACNPAYYECPYCCYYPSAC